MKGGLTLAIPCRADEPGLAATLESLFIACQHSQLPPQLVSEFVICINGLKEGENCAPLAAVRDFCARQGLSIRELWLPEPSVRTPSPLEGEGWGGGELELGQVSTNSPLPSFIVLLTERKGKPPAWNTLWRWARGELVLFCDADVRVEKDAVYYLYTRLRQEPR